MSRLTAARYVTIADTFCHSPFADVNEERVPSGGATAHLQHHVTSLNFAPNTTSHRSASHVLAADLACHIGRGIAVLPNGAWRRLRHRLQIPVLPVAVRP